MQLKLGKMEKLKDPNCNFCNVQETMLHMLHYFKYATGIWNVGLDVGIQELNTGSGVSKQIDFFISLVSYLIYNQWLHESSKNQTSH